jgi:hypothetical protein
MHRGVSAAAITKALQAGRITETADGRIDVVAADAQWAANTRARADVGQQRPEKLRMDASAAAGAGAGTDDPDYWQSRAKREAAEAAKAELELGQMRGDLLEVTAVRTTWARVLSSAQQTLMQVAPRLAPVLAATTDAAEIQTLIDAELDRALEQITRGAI